MDSSYKGADSPKIWRQRRIFLTGQQPWNKENNNILKLQYIL